MTDPTHFGPCCACGTADPTVRNILMFDRRAPVPGTGWGCFACGLPQDGAVAVVCDACLEAETPLRDVVAGAAASGLRAPYAACTEPFAHDPACHQGEIV